MTYRIVLVDDEADIRRLLRALLRKHTLFEATNGEEGLALIREVLPDVVLLDMMMPRMNGHEVAQILSSDAKTSSIPIVMLSAKGQASDIEAGYRSGVTRYLVKPFEPGMGRTAIEEIVKGNEFPLT